MNAINYNWFYFLASTFSCSFNRGTPTRSVISGETTSQINSLPTAIYEPISVSNYQRSIDESSITSNSGALSSRDSSRPNSSLMAASTPEKNVTCSSSSSCIAGKPMCTTTADVRITNPQT